MSASADPKIKPWDKQPDESSKRYYAFCLYRDMGANERSLSKVAKELAGANTGRIKGRLKRVKEWSAQDKWVSRAEAWDVEQDRLTRQAHDKAIKAMAKRHVDISLLLQQKAVERLKELHPALDTKDLKPADALKAIEIATKLERQTLGEPDAIIKHEGEIKSGDNELTEQILNDPEATELACKLFERIAVGKSDAGGSRKTGEQASVDSR